MATDFSAFLKEHKKEQAEEEYAVSKAFVDENGDPVKWRFRAITTEKFNKIKESCTKMKQIPGKRGQYRPETDVDLLNNKMIVACTVYPDLLNTKLQDSYGVSTPEELLYSMVDNPGEYSDLLAFVNELCGFDMSLEEKAEEAKN